MVVFLATLATIFFAGSIQASENACLADGYPTIECLAYRLHTTVKEAQLGLDWYSCIHDELRCISYEEKSSGTFESALDEAMSTCPDNELVYLTAYPTERHEIYRAFQETFESPPPRPTNPGVTVVAIPDLKPGGAGTLMGMECIKDRTPTRRSTPTKGLTVTPVTGVWMSCIVRELLAIQKEGSTSNYLTAIDIAERSCIDLRADALASVSKLREEQANWRSLADEQFRNMWNQRPIQSLVSRIRSDWQKWTESHPISDQTIQSFYEYWKDQWFCYDGDWFPNAPYSQEFVTKAITN